MTMSAQTPKNPPIIAIPTLQASKPLRDIVHAILSHDMPPHLMRGLLMDWDNDTEEQRKTLMLHARAIERGQPIRSYVESAQRMAELALIIL